ncbi:MAG: NAD-dependent epimerase/dehydratase family protein [Chloroflexi bacterium]|nr:NAD-dependent epimerase/dehydratase family protein [Chloroflexota bacterium]
MATLVTGSSGFVCVNVARTLATLGEPVVAFDLTPPDDRVRAFLAPADDHVTFVTGDVCDGSLVERTIAERGVDAVIHGAVITATTPEVESANPGRTASVNLGGTIAVLEAARKANVRRFVYVSSGSVYGVQGSLEQPLDETTTPRPAGLYGITKLAAEQTVIRWNALHGLDTAAVRLSSPYGPMERPTHARVAPSLVYAWATAAVRGERPVLPHLEGFRDWTYVDDTAAGIVAAWRAERLTSRVFNIGVGTSYTAPDLLKAIQAVIPSFEVGVSPDRGLLPGIWGRDNRGTLDVSLAHRELGFDPQCDLTAGIARYVEWLKASTEY